SMGLPFVSPNNALDYSANFLNMMFRIGDDHRVNPVLAKAMDLLFILHADHEQNCGTTAMRVVASSHADPYSAAAAASAALYGPLHGGANEAVVHMLTEIGSIDNVPAFIADVKAGKGRLMGFGHRVYKNYDPRAAIIKKAAYDVFEVTGKNPLLDIALKLEETALKDDYFVQRKLYPNVDFYSGLIYQALGFPVSPGRLVPITVTNGATSVSHFAFVPDPLPVTFRLSVDAWLAVAEAGRRLAALNAVVNERFPNPQLLMRPTIRREAVSTSAIEGTFAAIDEVMQSELDASLPRTTAVQEVINFVRATEHAYKRRHTLPISSRFACELHRILFAGTAGEDWQTGLIRKTQVFIASARGSGIRSAAYVPPPPGDALRSGLSHWEKWIHSDVKVHPLVKIAAAHYQFEAIHPFTDGNGRIGRLIAVLQLVDYELLSHPIINLSPYFETRSDQYRTLMSNISKRGNWNEWFIFFCNGLAHQALEAESRVRAAIIWRDAMLERLRKHRVKGVAIDVVQRLIEYPTVSVQTIA
ncbi:MAG: hypothetical protein EBZ46_08045, partial [Actinobacteria bacterium]|nr:hypothetical protein [Actinomycetota bacterium]